MLNQISGMGPLQADEALLIMQKREHSRVIYTSSACRDAVVPIVHMALQVESQLQKELPQWAH